MDTKIDNFVMAFSDFSTVERVCDCGKIYIEYEYSHTLSNVERVKINIDHNRIEVDCVRIIGFMGKEYIEECACWKEQAEKIMGFIDSHKYQIASYLNSEKERVIRDANAEPTVSI